MNEQHKPYIGRLAPSPTGLLHTGHAHTFKIAHDRAKSGKLLLRNEDIDPERCTDEYTNSMLEDLKWLGLNWEEQVFTQSQRMPLYLNAWKQLQAANLIYPCRRSRKEIGTANVFPKEFRGKYESKISPDNLNWRFKVPYGKTVTFCDNRSGSHSFIAGKDFGDFLIWRKVGVPSYELAVVVDDADMSISEVVRGEDLLLSTARQILLYQALNLTIPEFYHCELILDAQGKRLAKRHDSLSIRELKNRGLSPQHILDGKSVVT